MRIATIAVSSIFIACLAIVPASAAKKKSHVSQKMVDSFEACEQKALAQGLVHGQSGHTDFVAECMGRRPTNSAAQH
jgi:hypothetical protein